MPAFLHDPEFWVLVATLVFVAVVWKPGRRALIGGLDARAAQIRTELDEARNLRDQAQQMLADYQRKQQDAVEEAEQIVVHAQQEAERLAGQSARALEETLQRRQRLAEERIAQAQAQALADIRAIAVDIAIGAAREVIAAQLDDRRRDALVEAAIAALPQQLP